MHTELNNFKGFGCLEKKAYKIHKFNIAYAGF